MLVRSHHMPLFAGLTLLFIVLSEFVTVPAEATEAAWARLADGGYTVLLGHAQMAGSGDPPGFDLEDCSTQSPLTDNGRQQARRQGTRFAARAVAIAAVYASQYCRAQETAELAFGSQEIEPAPEFNLIDPDAEGAQEQIEAMIARIDGFNGAGNQIVITHPENIRILTGSLPRAGEAIVMAPTPPDGDRPRVVGRILLN